MTKGCFVWTGRQWELRTDCQKQEAVWSWRKPHAISDTEWEKMEEWERAELARTWATGPPQTEKVAHSVKPEGVTDEEWESAKEIARIRAAEASPENTSGTGQELPAELGRMGWCWGGFTFTFIWAFANRAVWIGILCLIPVVFVGVAFYLGAEGHKVAWMKRRFESVQQYRDTMRVWDKWGLWWFIANISLFALSVVMEALAT